MNSDVYFDLPATVKRHYLSHGELLSLMLSGFRLTGKREKKER
jgi:hypothetical protein